jgi:hypothetical protein
MHFDEAVLLELDPVFGALDSEREREDYKLQQPLKKKDWLKGNH